MRYLKLQPLTKIAFAPYGDVIETIGAESFPINNATTTRYHDLAKIELAGDNARALISIARCQKFTLPLEIKMMERHPLGSQAFIPLSANPYMIVVAEDEYGVPGQPQAFAVNANQGVNYRANIWHATLVTFEAESDFLIVDRGGDGNNLEEHFFDSAYLVNASNASL